METSAPSDPELLADWLDRHREPAFHTLVARYAGLVHATAKRTCGDDSMAAEAFQLTFIALARKAKSLTSCASLGGWLHLGVRCSLVPTPTQLEWRKWILVNGRVGKER